MDPYFIGVMLLSAGSFIHSKSDVPELRPEDDQVDNAWRWLSRAAFFGWLLMLVWGAMHLDLWVPAAAFVASLTANAFLALRGPQSAWPALSVACSLAGLALSSWRVFG